MIQRIGFVLIVSVADNLKQSGYVRDRLEKVLVAAV
jgi:hypothetical protein